MIFYVNSNLSSIAAQILNKRVGNLILKEVMGFCNIFTLYLTLCIIKNLSFENFFTVSFLKRLKVNFTNDDVYFYS